MKTIYYPNEIRSHLVTIAPMAPFTSKSTSKLWSALHFRYLIVITRFISHANTDITIITTVFITLLITNTLLIVTNYCAQ